MPTKDDAILNAVVNEFWNNNKNWKKSKTTTDQSSWRCCRSVAALSPKSRWVILPSIAITLQAFETIAIDRFEHWTSICLCHIPQTFVSREKEMFVVLFFRVSLAKLIMQQSFDEPSWPLCQCCDDGCVANLTSRYGLNSSYVGLEIDASNSNQYFRVNNNVRYTYSRATLNNVGWKIGMSNITVTLWVKFTNENKFSSDWRIISNLVSAFLFLF